MEYYVKLFQLLGTHHACQFKKIQQLLYEYPVTVSWKVLETRAQLLDVLIMIVLLFGYLWAEE